MSFVSRTELTGFNPGAQTAPGFGAATFERRTEGLTIDFRSVLSALVRRKWWIILPAVIGAVIGLLAAMSIEPRFSSTVQLLVDPREVQVVKSDTPLRTPTPDGSAIMAENAMIMLRSANVQMQVVDKHRLYEDPEFVGSPGLISSLLGRNAVDPLDVRRLRAMNGLDRRLTTRRTDKSSVVEASVFTMDPAKSALLANSLAAAFLEQQTASEQDTARRALQATNARLVELGQRVEKTERDVEDYRARNNLQSSSGRLVSEQQMQEMTSQLVMARARAADARAKYDAARKLTVTGIERGEIPEAVNSQLIGQLRLKYAEASRLEADARQKFGDRHPEMMALAAQARDSRAQIIAELNRIVKAAQTDFERSKAAEEQLQQALAQARTQTSDTSEASVKLRELERQADVSRQIYSAFLKRTRELAEQEDINPISARVISPANPAQYSTSMSRSVVLMGLTITGGLLGLLLTLLLEQFDATLRNRKQFQELSGLPVLAEFSGFQGRRSPDDPLRAPVIDKPRSAAALAAVRVADTFAARADADRPRVVLLVGVGQVDTTELTLNVAIAAAQASWRVLLVDADGGGTGLSRHLEVQPGTGLREVLEGTSRFSASVLNDDRTAVRILPLSGTARSRASFRPSAAQVATQVLDPAANYELIFVDGGVWGTDATAYAFAGAVDDIVLVAPSGRIAAHDVSETLEGFAPFRDKLAGIVTA